MSPIKEVQIGHPIRYLPEWRHDPYQTRRKWPEPSICLDCGAVYREGRWRWPLCPQDGDVRICPACQRMRDGMPAAYLTIRGGFYEHHRHEVEGLIGHIVERERSAHPQKRLMGNVKHADGSRVLTFSEPHLASDVGDQLRRAYDGNLEIEYQKGEYLVRLQWTREE
jgi:hypothetical protein